MNFLTQYIPAVFYKQAGLGSVRVCLGLLCSFMMGYSSISYAGPTGGNIVGGAGSIQQSNLTTNIHQNTPSMVINWNSYNLKANEVVNYLQPGASSIALNRILSNSPSQILGQINANGRVALVNPYGVLL
jgi:trimeric autotransporter adhesin